MHFLSTQMLKIMVAVNNFVLDSSAISMLLFLVSVPGFALVAYSHVEVGLPMSDNVPCVVMPALLGIIAFTSSSRGTKKKSSKKQ